MFANGKPMLRDGFRALKFFGDIQHFQSILSPRAMVGVHGVLRDSITLST